ncbi:ATP-dependent DNA helicase [Trichonephila clavipes]|nr:ATP-dependent DNA helicase [Trichonephila clavipes]
MPRKRKSNLSQRPNSARAKKVARCNETFPQAELRRLEQAEREAAHRAAETPERSQSRRQCHAEYLKSQRAAETPEQSQARRLQHATYVVSQRDTETTEAAESRKRAVAERAQQRRLILKKTRPNSLGQMVILPSSFVNSARYLHEYTHDAFIYVRKYGTPDLFISMTCNLAWTEITRELIPGQNSTDRHDLTARVFKQKRGLPHETVAKINKKILGEIVSETSVYNSIDTVMSSDDTASYPVEFLSSLDLSGVPSHKLELKVGVPVLLMSNLDAPRLCNGTRLRITELGRHIVKKPQS